MIARCLLSCLIFAALVSGDETFGQSYSYVAGHIAHASSNDTTSGFVDAMIMSRDDRPVICFGAQKRPTDKGRFTYIILFSPTAPQSGFSVEAAGRSDGGSGAAADVSAKFKLKEFELTVAYSYASDKTTGALTSEKLQIDGKEVATEPTAVFLAERIDGKTKLNPVKVRVTTLPPDLGDEKKELYPFSLEQTIDALKKESPEVAAFLQKK